MGQSRGHFAFWPLARLVALAVSCFTLANCTSGHYAGRIDPRYGVASSPRVIEPGQPVPKGGGVYRVGRPYTVAGRTYVPTENVNYNEVGLASWYGDDFHGRYTANGEIFDENSISAAHPTLPLPSYARVTNLRNHRSIVVRVNDRGPYAFNRLIDVSVRTAKLLGFYGQGVAPVRVQYVGRAPLKGSDDSKLAATLRSPVQVASAEDDQARYLGAPSLTEMPRRVTSPPPRPYRLGEGERAVPAARRATAPTTELAASSHPLTNTETPSTSLVSDDGPVGYDGNSSGFIDGRGLY